MLEYKVTATNREPGAVETLYLGDSEGDARNRYWDIRRGFAYTEPRIYAREVNPWVLFYQPTPNIYKEKNNVQTGGG